MRHVIRKENRNKNFALCGAIGKPIKTSPGDHVCGICVTKLIDKATDRLGMVED